MQAVAVHRRYLGRVEVDIVYAKHRISMYAPVIELGWWRNVGAGAK